MGGVAGNLSKLPRTMARLEHIIFVTFAAFRLWLSAVVECKHRVLILNVWTSFYFNNIQTIQ